MARIDTTLPGLEWMADEQAAEQAAAHANDNDKVRELRARQSAQRKAQRARTTGTNLSERDAKWLFQSAVIIEVPNA